MLAGFLERLRAAPRRAGGGARDPGAARRGPTSRCGSRWRASRCRCCATRSGPWPPGRQLGRRAAVGPRGAAAARLERAGRCAGGATAGAQPLADEVAADAAGERARGDDRSAARSARQAERARGAGRAAAPAGLAVRAGRPWTRTWPRLEARAAGGGPAGPARRAGGFPGRSPTGTGVLNVEPVVQKRGQGRACSRRGRALQWYQLPDRRELTPADRRAYQAYDDRFARAAEPWERRALTPAQVFGILRALIDHPAVFLDGARERPRDDGRLDIRQGRLRLRFASAPDGSLAPQFELLGVTLLAPEVAPGPARRAPPDAPASPRGRPRRRCCWRSVSPQAAAVVRGAGAGPGALSARGPRRPGHPAGVAAGDDGHRVPVAVDAHHRPGRRRACWPASSCWPRARSRCGWRCGR